MFDRSYVTKLFEINPTIKSLLIEAQTIVEAREFLRAYFNEYAAMLSRNKERLQPLEWDLQNNCLMVLRKIVSIRSERLTKFSLVKLLWKLAKDDFEELPDDLSDGFFAELTYLFLGLKGQSGIYSHEKIPEFVRKHGRDAAVVRSDQLDDMTETGKHYIKRYKTGLDKDIREKRISNKKRIQAIFGATDQQWDDYLWHLQHVIRNSQDLEKCIDLTDEERDAIDRAKAGKLPFGITPYYVSLMDKESHRTHDHAVRAQVIPPMNYVQTLLENRKDHSYHFDFMLEHDTSPIDLITRRYPRICILKPYNTCSQICVYCQRNWEIDDVLNENALATKANILKAIEWIKEHDSIEEVLITGGDPLVMNDARVEFVLSRVAEIQHVERIRIGSRTPVVLPQRMTENLMNIIARYHDPGQREVVLVTHFEHTYEVTPEALEAIQQFRQRGISVYNQAVFTLENSRRYELVALRRALRLIGVDPYYTFNTKGKKETTNYRVPLARLMQEIKEEARLMPGTVRTDEPVYNVPRLGKNYIRARQNHSLISILADGSRVYEFHPWEKKLALADTFIDTDVPIYDYLLELQRRGESIEDYKTIWYYF